MILTNPADRIASDPIGRPVYVQSFTNPPHVVIITPRAQPNPTTQKDTMTNKQGPLRDQLMQTIMENSSIKVDSVLTTPDVHGGMVITLVMDDVTPEVQEVITRALSDYGITPTQWKTNPWKDSWLRLMIWADQAEETPQY